MIRVLFVIALLALTELPAPEPAQLGFATARVFAPPTVLFQIMDVSAATTLSAPGGSVTAGTGEATLRGRFEAITP